MKKGLTLALAVLMGFMAITLMGGATATAETTEKMTVEPLFAAAGTGRVSVEPDIAYVTIGVRTEAKEAKEAMDENSRQMNAVLDALKKAGLTEDDLRTSNVSIDAVYDYSKDTRVFKGYMAQNSLYVTIRDLDNVADVLDAAIAAGANDVNNIYFDKEDKTAAYDEALAKALQLATDKINVLHEASGIAGELTPVAFTEAGVQTITYKQMKSMAFAVPEAATYGVQIVPGQVEVTASVNVEYKVTVP